ncbi:MAG: GerMN domain-containing protein [Vicinamibacterales bacterium]
MTGRRVIVAALVAATAIGLGWGMFSVLGRRLAEPTPDAEPAPVAPAAPAPAAAPHISATLYFVSEDGVTLQGVPTDVPLRDTPDAQARALVEAQLAAEPPAPLARAVPAGARVRAAFVTGRDDAYVDLDGTFVTGLAGGSHNELLATYAIVSVITTNLNPVARVQILIDGREVETLTGHVDLREPLRKNEALIRPAP